MSKTELWAIDTEDDSKGNVTLINFYNGKEHITFDVNTIKKRCSKREKTRIMQSRAVEWLASNSKSMNFWATNLQYDLNNIFYTQPHVLTYQYVGSRIIKGHVEGTGLTFLDTLNHWKISVKEMGERIGIKKIETTDFHNVKYCQRDTEITWHFVKRMQDSYRKIGCELKATIGATSLQYYFANFAKKPKDRLFTKNQLEFMHRGYYGGRTEIFHTEPVQGKIFYFDFNSLYPAVSCGLFPRLENAYFTKKPNLNLEGMLDATLTRQFNDNFIPYLPCRDEHGGLCFPLGRFRGVYTYFEIREALELGYKLEKIHQAFEFPAGSFHPFQKFMETIYSERLKAKENKDELMSDAYKLLMNNLYGKWGQGGETEALVPHEGNPKSGDLVFGALSLRVKEDEFPIHANKIWAAYTTAYGRSKLYSALIKIKKAGALLLYCDTDSVIFKSEEPIFKNMTELGELKLEGIFEYAHFKLPKMYRLDQKYRSKGVPRKYAAEYFNRGSAKFKKPLKLREVLRRNMLAAKHNKKKKVKKRKLLIPNYWLEVEKISNKKYDKRQTSSDGTTKPHIFNVRRGKNGNTTKPN